jgi:hypothetical protein
MLSFFGKTRLFSRLHSGPLAAALLLALCGRAMAQTAAAPPPPVPENYDGRYPQYAQAVEAYIRDNPDSMASPRVAMDLLVTATGVNDTSTADRMRMVLVGNFPGTVQGKYLISTLPDAASFSQIMTEVADLNFENLQQVFAQRFDTALRLGAQRFGAAALGDGGQLVRVALISAAVNDTQMLQVAYGLLAQGGQRTDLWRRILLTVTDSSTPALKRLGQLHAMSFRQAAIPFEMFLLSHLSADDKATPQAQTISADNLLQLGRMSEALPLLEKLCDTPNPEPRLQFWKAWATAANGDALAAQKELKALSAAHADDPWGKMAGDLASTAGAIDASVSAHVEGALAVSRRLKAGVEAVEAHATYLRDDGQKISMYLGMSAPKYYQIMFQKGSDTQVAYKVNDAESWLFVHDDGKLQHYTKPVLMPVPQLTPFRAGTDIIFRSVYLGFVQTFDDLKSSYTNLTSADLLSTREGLAEVLKNFTKKGLFPAPAQPPAAGSSGGTVFTWVSPDVTTPTVGKLSITVAADGAVTAIHGGSFDVSDLHYGSATTVVPNPPAMPSATTVEAGAMSPSAIYSAMPSVLQLFFPAPPSTQPAATKPAAK